MTNVANWLQANTPACIEQLNMNDSESEDSTLLITTFTLPYDMEQWPDLISFTFAITAVIMDGFSVPNEAQISCTDLYGNDEWTFPEPWYEMEGNLYDTLLISAMNASLSGPVFLGGRITGSQFISSQYNTCSHPWCSSAVFVEDETIGIWEIASMELYADSKVTLSNGTYSHEIEGVVISAILAGGYIEHGPTKYVIDAGDAWFLVTGKGLAGSGPVVQVPISNSTDIEAELDSGEWTLSAFDLEFVDSNNDVWEISIPASTWE